jgi:hypothetical protein
MLLLAITRLLKRLMTCMNVVDIQKGFMAEELLFEKTADKLSASDQRFIDQSQPKQHKPRSKSSGTVERCYDGCRLNTAVSSYTPATLSTATEENSMPFATTVDVMDRDFQFYRRYRTKRVKLTDAVNNSCFPGIGTIAAMLMRGCRSHSAGRLRDSRSDFNCSDDDDDDDTEFIELYQINDDIRVRGRRSRLTDAGHKLVPVRITTLLWCDKCGQPIVSVYKHCFVCKCKY